MRISEIWYYATVNETDPKKVEKIKSSIIKNGWNGTPILVHSVQCEVINGCHRLAALRQLFEEDEMDDIEVAEAVDEIIDRYCEENDITMDEIRHIEDVFEGTEFENYI